jgi:anti-sigma regulatory factor (Ser/Thr protein kinase)
VSAAGTDTDTGTDAVVDALRSAFVDDAGRPVPVRVRPLTPAEAAQLPTGGAEGVRVVVLGEAELAALPDGARPTAAVAVVDGAQAVLLAATAPVSPRFALLAAGIGDATAGLADTVRRLRSEVAFVDALHAVGRRLTAQLDLGRVVQEATDAATTATGAAFGAFFYNLVDHLGESYTLYTISGVPREAFAGFPMPRNTEVFAPTFDGTGTVRSDDIVGDPRFGRNAPYYGMPEGHLPVRSYLAVSVVSPTTGEVIGGFFFGHPEPGRFTERHAFLAEGIAGYAAIAVDNARLFDRERDFATELSRSLLPVVPDVRGLRVVTRYLPAATGAKIGGDWFDVIRLPSGGTAFVIGDVVGHGVTAATTMGQVRTAIRSYARLEMAPTEVLRHVSALTAELAETGFVTCFYAVHGVDGWLTYASAGHLPALLLGPDGGVEPIGEAMAQPLGVGREFAQRRTAFPRGSRLLLYTDGLVESRSRDVTQGIAWLCEAVDDLRAAPDPERACDRLIAELTPTGHDDDIALIYVHNTDGPAVVGPGDFHRRVTATADRLVGVRTALQRWLSALPLDEVGREDVVLASYEAMANSAEHGYHGREPGDVDVRAEHRDGRLTVTVTDWGTWKPPDPTDTLRGRGLLLINSLAAESTTTNREDGTTVAMTWLVP